MVENGGIIDMLRCFFSSPFASYAGSKEDAVWAAARSLVRLKGYLRPVLHVDEVTKSDVNCVWSPLLHGQFILWDRGGMWDERHALAWCLHCLEFKGFNCLSSSDTNPRAKGHGWNGMDAENALARKLGHRVVRESDVAGL